ncbi:MAG: AraC family transcriptional regulator [Algoriphagus marincola HL-49]|uniref:AraC family transcriptional regulator n=1 Tax=Algoriphagus marincola HL-49 TaxID=1305737 RepID=A0A0P8A7Y9_9BACT|nr:MAG: AraC family transcriptional regulator [Algoriphagus marincola HL-49]
MQYQEFPAPPFLLEYASLFWFDACTDANFPAMEYNLIADGEPGIIFHEIPGSVTINGFSKLPQLMIYGQKTRWSSTLAKPPYKNIGIVLKPYALKALFGIDANELTDSALPLSDLVNCERLLDQLMCNNGLGYKINAIVSFLCQLKPKLSTGLVRLRDTISLYDEGLPLYNIQRELKVSERTLERSFQQELGVSPVMYKRIHRFNFALNLIHQNEFDTLTGLGYRAGYADQSHFIRDFKAFAGVTPRAYLIKSKGKRAYPKE